ncbi:hypothetical protein GCM10011487_56940 [Steroidobacter agaridevorans]|uniref:DUF4185 domain-containing protein n=1 Tax=Steroidobacter agaridevorans TaxID=2695856 RepID=A0A829YJW3_9GAMM|nr:DUF4185 domain-containing protein [Steroidobacter agaridevorans]GFE83694.1 hypothetical protein GCM10011487_56940 [Steroidobacter agaridevorans]
MRREETTLRLGGNGDNFHMTWAADDDQFVAVCDGLGWLKDPKRYYNSRLYRIAGGPQQAQFREVEGYPELTGLLNTENIQRYYGFGTLAMNGHIYQFLSTPNHQFTSDAGTVWPGARFVGVKLIFSPDEGRTWFNQSRATPVVWEPWSERSKINMLFFEEPQDAFSLLSVLQMGQNYAQNKDGYIYVYAPNGNTEGTMNQLVMFRVPTNAILHRDEYEYFAGLQQSGSARWVRDLGARSAVHTFPSGWVNTSIHPWAWMPSVTYNAPLGLFMMVSWGMGCAPDGSWFGKPSYLGLWVATNPWGPWSQIHEETSWIPQNDPAARAFAPQISPKWISRDGKSFWLVWADFQKTGGEQAFERLLKEGLMARGDADTVRFFQKAAKAMPYYAFNAQRVDLIVG